MTSASSGFFTDPYLTQPPVKRAAYSDRMALLMAWMSGLAYTKFENTGGAAGAKTEYLESIIERIAADEDGASIRDIIEDVLDNPLSPSTHHSKAALMAQLQEADFELVNTYSTGNQQAFLAKRPATPTSSAQEEKIVVLSFRGTEGKKISDWKDNLKATKKTIEGDVIVHSGYWDAFKGVDGEPGIEALVRPDLEPLQNAGYTLYITGHSMGGAMAMMATHEIGEDSAGACYTFGAPRVAGYGFAENIKTPIYRLVNANDVVPRLPPVFLPHILQFALTLSPIPWKAPIERILEKFTGYVHHGDMRYLRRASEIGGGKFDEIQLISNPNMVHRFRWFVIGFLRSRRSPINDHAIDLYKGKLKQHALKRGGKD